MYERMLNKQVKPTVADMTGYCGENAELFTYLNEWLEKPSKQNRRLCFPMEINMVGGLLTGRKRISSVMYFLNIIRLP